MMALRETFASKVPADLAGAAWQPYRRENDRRPLQEQQPPAWIGGHGTEP